MWIAAILCYLEDEDKAMSTAITLIFLNTFNSWIGASMGTGVGCTCPLCPSCQLDQRWPPQYQPKGRLVCKTSLAQPTRWVNPPLPILLEFYLGNLDRVTWSGEIEGRGKGSKEPTVWVWSRVLRWGEGRKPEAGRGGTDTQEEQKTEREHAEVKAHAGEAPGATTTGSMGAILNS